MYHVHAVAGWRQVLCVQKETAGLCAATWLSFSGARCVVLAYIYTPMGDAGGGVYTYSRTGIRHEKCRN